MTADKRYGHETIMSRGEKNMTKGRIAKYVANTALLAVLAAAGIGVYQLGTSGKDESVPEKVPSYYDESLSTENTTDNAVDAGTSLVEAELDSNISTDHTSEKGMSQTEGEDAGSETTEVGSSSTESTFTSESILSAEQSTNENGTVNTSASVQEAPKLSFSEDTLMEWPVDGNILMDYNMDQTVYFPTLDQYKLSPAIAVQAVEGAPVLASVPGTVYSIEENVQTGACGERVSEYVMRKMLPSHVLTLALPDDYIEHGSVDVLRKMTGIDSESMSEKIIETYKEL